MSAADGGLERSQNGGVDNIKCVNIYEVKSILSRILLLKEGLGADGIEPPTFWV